jgi:hypothetical protein
METEEKVIILAKINQIKDMQVYLLKEEKKLEGRNIKRTSTVRRRKKRNKPLTTIIG